MVRDGYFYGLGFVAAAVLVFLLTGNWLWAARRSARPFFPLVFSRPGAVDSGRTGVVVSPADGKVTEVARIQTLAGESIRVSIFLSVFDVHVNRSPIAGTVSEVRYQKGLYLNALNPESAVKNEQNSVTVENAEFSVIFRQIAGLLARRIVFRPKVGDLVERGQRVGLIKFGSRVDLVLPGHAEVRVALGERVKGGSSILAISLRRKDKPFRKTCGGIGLRTDESSSEESASKAAAQGHVHPAFALYLGKHRRRLLCDHAKPPRLDLEPQHFNYAALAIGFAIPFDALDGRIARMTNTASEFGKELDSLADVITFGVAPSVLAFTWGFHMLPPRWIRCCGKRSSSLAHSFASSICSAGQAVWPGSTSVAISRRRTPGGRVANILSACRFLRRGHHCRGRPFFSGTPVPNWWVALIWMALVGLIGFLMVSTWRFWSGKEINLANRIPFNSSCCWAW